MAFDDDIGAVVDERGDSLEALFWGSVFLFTAALFFWEFGLGAVESGNVNIQPIGAITDFAQTMWLAALVGGGGVVLLIVYAVFRYSSGMRERPERLSPGEGSLKFTVFVLAVTAIMATTVFVGASTLAQTDEATAGDAAERYAVDREVEMSVTAAQWFWRFDVEGVPGAQGEHVVLPGDTIVQFQTTSADVIHSFAIKELGITKDAVPGQVNKGWFYVGEVDGETELTVTNNGSTEQMAADSYEVRCAELCGKGHSKMLATVYIVSPDDYRTYVEANGGNPDGAFSVPDDGIQVGEQTTPGDDGHDEGSGDGHDEGSGDGSGDGHDDGTDEGHDDSGGDH